VLTSVLMLQVDEVQGSAAAAVLLQALDLVVMAALGLKIEDTTPDCTQQQENALSEGQA